MYRIAGDFRMVQIFAFFREQSRAKQSTQKLKLGETPTHRYFTCKACGGCGFLVLKREHYNFEISSEGSRAIQQKCAPSKISVYFLL